MLGTRKFQIEMQIILFVNLLLFGICTASFGQSDVISQQRSFPANFKFGAATSSYQIEGAWNADGKGENIWDNFTHKYPDKIADGSNGDVAANSYKYYKEDVKALKYIGVNHYRFSINWARILPNGDLSKINPLGLRYYNNLINELLANGIEPLVTIYHLEMPQKLEDIGGMLNPIIVEHFVNYARTLFENFGDRVKLWGTFNEPNIMCEYGYGSSIIAPYVNSPGVGDYICGKNLLLAHAKIYRLYHDHFNKDKKGKIGIILAASYCYPKDPNNPEDVAAANRKFQFWLGWFAQPIFGKNGGYPELMEDIIRQNSRKEKLNTSRLPAINDNERRLIQGTADYLFLNYYSSELESAATESDYKSWPSPSYSKDVNTSTSMNPDWPAYVVDSVPFLAYVPKGLRDLLKWIKKAYNNPKIFITENGWANNGGIDDADRVKYIKGHLQALLDAIWEDGANVYGYTTWSLIDDFEWTFGYIPKFGLYQVDFSSPNKTRTARKSATFLKQVILSRRIPN